MSDTPESFESLDDTKKTQGLVISISRGSKETQEHYERTIHLCSVENAELTARQAEVFISILVNLVRTWGIDIYKVESEGETVWIHPGMQEQVDLALAKAEGRLN